MAVLLGITDSSRCPLSVKAVHNACKARFVTDSPEVDMSYFPQPANGMDCDNTLKRITGENACKEYGTTRPDSASGPDKICIRSSIKWDLWGTKLS